MPLQTRNATAYTYLGLCPACCPAFLAPVLPVGGSMYPGCYASDCSNWGIEKAFDADEATTAGTNWDPFPRMQFDLGSIRTDVQAVLIRSRADCCYWHANGLIVYVSEETDYFGGTVCIRGLEFGGYGEEKSVPCPAGLSVRYVTLVRWYANDMLGVSEVSVLATRKQSACLGRGGGGTSGARCVTNSATEPEAGQCGGPPSISMLHAARFQYHARKGWGIEECLCLAPFIRGTCHPGLIPRHPPMCSMGPRWQGCTCPLTCVLLKCRVCMQPRRPCRRRRRHRLCPTCQVGACLHLHLALKQAPAFHACSRASVVGVSPIFCMVACALGAVIQTAEQAVRKLQAGL